MGQFHGDGYPLRTSGDLLPTDGKLRSLVVYSAGGQSLRIVVVARPPVRSTFSAWTLSKTMDALVEYERLSPSDISVLLMISVTSSTVPSLMISGSHYRLMAELTLQQTHY